MNGTLFWASDDSYHPNSLNKAIKSGASAFTRIHLDYLGGSPRLAYLQQGPRKGQYFVNDLLHRYLPTADNIVNTKRPGH
jgi:hypothetical protein